MTTEDWQLVQGTWHYRGEDAGCLEFYISTAGGDYEGLDFSVVGADVGLDTEGLKRLAAIMLADSNDQIERALKP